MRANITQGFIASQRLGVGVPVLPDAGTLPRRNQDFSLRHLAAEGLIDRALVIDAIGGHARHGLVDLSQHRLDHLSICHSGVAQHGRLDFARRGIHGQMNFGPGSTLRPAVLANFPLAFALDFQATTIQDQMQVALGSFRKLNLNRVTAPREGRVIWNRQVRPHQLEQRAHQPFRRPIGQAKDFFDRQHRFNRSVTIVRLRTPLGGTAIGPALQGFVRNPDRQRASLDQRLVIGRPISNGVSCLPAWTSASQSILWTGFFGGSHTPKITRSTPFVL